MAARSVVLMTFPTKDRRVVRLLGPNRAHCQVRDEAGAPCRAPASVRLADPTSRYDQPLAMCADCYEAAELGGPTVAAMRSAYARQTLTGY